jgi:colanic acid biosynthesis glycosyl transferase WcaI
LKRVGFVTPYYWPEDFGAGVQCTEIAEYLVKQGHEVHVFTQMPNYPKGIIFPEYESTDRKIESHNGVTIHRIKAQTSGREASLKTKGLASLDFGRKVQKLFKGTPKFDTVLSISPPPFAGLAAKKLAKRDSARFVVRVADIASLAIKTAGASNNPAAKILQKLEIKMLRSADHLCLAADYFVPFIDEFVDKSKERSIVFDWADGDAIRPMPRQNEISKAWGIDDKFVVMYSGSIGYTSNLLPLLEAANELKTDDSIRFIIIGEGIKKAELVAYAEQHQLSNVEFKPLQPREIFNLVLASSDIQVISLTEEGAKSSGQGKLKTILAAGKPVLAIVPEDSNEAILLSKQGIGVSSDTHMETAIQEMMTCFNLNTYGQRARTYFSNNFESYSCLRQITDSLNI